MCAGLSAWLAAASFAVGPPPVYTVGPASHHEVGRQIGMLGADRIKGWLQAYGALPALQEFAASSRGSALLARLEHASCTAFPLYCDELRGVSLAFRGVRSLPGVSRAAASAALTGPHRL